MDSVTLQDTRSIQKNHLDFQMNNPKIKLRKQFHSE